MDEVLATLAQVPRKPREKEAGADGVTTQADRMQQCTAQGSPGKVFGVHGWRDLRRSPTQSTSGRIVFIMPVLSALACWVLSQVIY